jgi:hypothetical protein
MRTRLELNRVKQDLMIDFGEVGSHLPDADLYACIHVQMTDRKGYFRLLQKSVTTSAIPINKAATPTIHKGKASFRDIRVCVFFVLFEVSEVIAV